MQQFLSTNTYHRILYHHRTQGQGAEGVHIRGMVEGFRDCGYIVDIIAPPGIDTFKTETISTQGNSNKFSRFWHVLSENLPQFSFEAMELVYNFYAYRKLSKMLNNYNYDFLYERYALNNFAMAHLAQRSGLPLVLEVNDATIIERSRPCLQKRLSRFVEKKVFDRSRLLITISNYFKQLIIEQHGIPEAKILVLPNAVDPNRFKINPLSKLQKEDLGIKAKYIIGFVGAFVQWHGLSFFIQAISDLLEKMDIHVLLVGDGPARKDVDRVINVLNIHNRVTITGFIDAQNIPYYIELFDIGLVPNSNMHCSPMKIFEYMAMGIPVIAPAYPPIREIIDDGINGSIFIPHDKKIFRRKIKTLLDDENMRNRMGKAAKEKVMKQFTWQRNVEKLQMKMEEEIIQQ